MSIVIIKNNKKLVRPAEYKSLFERNGFEVLACGSKEFCLAMLESI